MEEYTIIKAKNKYEALKQSYDKIYFKGVKPYAVERHINTYYVYAIKLEYNTYQIVKERIYK